MSSSTPTSGYQNPGGYDVIGSVYFDANANGIPGEPDDSGITDVTVNLVDASGDVIATAVTDGNGAYTFENVPDGSYTVVVGDTENVLGELVQSGDPGRHTRRQT